MPLLAAHGRHPRLEHLVKMGFWELASGLAYGCSSWLLDEGQDRPHRVLRVGAEDVAFLRRLDPLRECRGWQKLIRGGLTAWAGK